MADQFERMKDLLEEIMEEANSGELDPDNDLSWKNHESHETNSEDDYHE